MIDHKAINDDNRDDHIDDEILSYLDIDNPKSFFLFAGAGSGKTRSLVKVLDELKENYSENLRIKGQKIAVITYTNAACDEIMSRLGYNPLFAVSTIHSFVWDLIKPHQEDIKKWLKFNLADEVHELIQLQGKGRSGTKASIDREKSINNKRKRLAFIENIRRFTYNPNGNKHDRDSLNHSEVIGIGAYFINEKELMQNILINRYPILLIDESQDTNKYLMEAFLKVQSKQPNRFSLGLFGDTMQRIYNDGKIDLGKDLPQDWNEPEKVMNHRCPKRVVKLINRTRTYVDDHEQTSRTDKEEGIVRLFVCSTQKNKESTEKIVAQKMMEMTGDRAWADAGSGYKQLILEHHMAASRLGFSELFYPLYSVDSFKTSLMDGTLSGLRFFTQLILPVVNAHERNDKFGIASVVRKNSPFMKIKSDEINKLGKIKDAKIATEELLLLWKKEKIPTCLEVLQCVAKSKLFEIPDSLYAIANRTESEQKIADNEKATNEKDDSSESEKNNAWDEALKAPFSHIKIYDSYINGKSSFDTHQGVKGLEFPHVMVIIDDSEARGFLFSYDKLFGVKEKTETDLRNEREGKDTSISRTRRLFYVACSRAKKSLAIVLYSSKPKSVKEHVLIEEWFEENEIEII
jgi:DNA helicase-2/ATP-dependent DNA helicase PcrA